MSPSGKISEAMVEAALVAYYGGSVEDVTHLRFDMRRALTAALSVPTPGTGGAYPDAEAVTLALSSLEQLANMPLCISLEQWSSFCSPILCVLQALQASPLFGADLPTPQGGDLGAGKVIDAWAHFHDGELLSVTLRKETADAYRKNGLDVRQLAALSSSPVGEMDPATIEACARIVEEGVEVPDPLDNHRSTVMRDWPSMDAAAAAIRRLASEGGER